MSNLMRSRRASLLVLKRSFAEFVSAPTAGHLSMNQPIPSTPSGLPTKGRIPVREDHGLYAFFRRKAGNDLIGDARFETVETPESVQKLPSGRAWRASELRLKSFKDLHTLWYVVLRERNLLATQKEETRRLGVSNIELQVNAARVHACRKTMARIKAVINERRLAYEGAVKLAEAEREDHYDNLVLEEQEKRFRKEASYLQKRREARRQAYEQKQAKLVGNTPQESSMPESAKPQLQDSILTEVESTNPIPPSPKVARSKQQPEVVFAEPRKAPPPKPIDTAAAGLFGEATTGKREG